MFDKLMILSAFALLLVLPGTAHAYLDAGTGSMILQILVAGVAGLAVFGRIFWRRVKAFFKGEPAVPPAAAEAARPAADEERPSGA